MTALSARATSSARPSQRAEEALYTCATVALSTIVGWAVAHGDGKKIAMLFIGGAVVAAAFRWPLAGVALIVALTCTVVPYGSLPSIHFGTTIFVPEIVAVVGLAGAIVRQIGRPWPHAVAWQAVFTGAALTLVAAMTARSIIEHHAVSTQYALSFSRTFLYLLLIPTLALSIDREETARRFLDVCIVIAGATAVVSCAASLSDGIANWVGNLDPDAVSGVTGDVVAAGPFSRVRLPGLALAYVLVLPTWVLLATGSRRGRSWRAVALLVMTFSVVVSFNRNMWIASAITAPLAVLIASPRARNRLVAVGTPAAVGGAVVVVLALILLNGADIASRLTSITSASHGSSLSDRLYETGLAYRAALHHPLLGIGPGALYGAYVIIWTGALLPRTFVHNQYLELWLYLGLPAAIAVLACVFYPTVTAVRTARARAANQLGSSLSAAVAATAVAVLLSSIVSMYLNRPASLCALAVVLGLGLAFSGLARTPDVAPTIQDRAGGPEPSPDDIDDAEKDARRAQIATLPR